VYEDAVTSGISLKRSGVHDLIADCRQGSFDVVVIYKLDRLSRNMRDLAYLFDLFDSFNVGFSSVCDSFDTTTANGRLVLNMLGSLAQWERDIIVERTRDALAHLKAERLVYGPLPLGYDLGANGSLVSNPKELETVRKIRKLRERGLSYHRIAATLNASQVETKRGGLWYAATIRYMLMNSLYTTV